MATKVGQHTLKLPLVSNCINWQTIETDVIDEWVMSTRDAVRDIESITLKAESEGIASEDLQRIRAHLHNMKGEAGFVGLAVLSDVCHRVETAMETVDDGDGFRADMLLDVVDWFTKVLDMVAAGEGGDISHSDDTAKHVRVLIVEDGVINRKLLQNILREVSACDVAVDGQEGFDAFLQALNDDNPYDVIFLDIMMPKMDGQKVLAKVRTEEQLRGILGSDCVKVVMTTALKDSKNVLGAFRLGCEGYLVKPIEKPAVLEKMRELNLLPN